MVYISSLGLVRLAKSHRAVAASVFCRGAPDLLRKLGCRAAALEMEAFIETLGTPKKSNPMRGVWDQHRMTQEEFERVSADLQDVPRAEIDGGRIVFSAVHACMVAGASKDPVASLRTLEALEFRSPLLVSSLGPSVDLQGLLEILMLHPDRKSGPFYTEERVRSVAKLFETDPDAVRDLMSFARVSTGLPALPKPVPPPTESGGLFSEARRLISALSQNDVSEARRVIEDTRRVVQESRVSFEDLKEAIVAAASESAPQEPPATPEPPVTPLEPPVIPAEPSGSSEPPATSEPSVPSVPSEPSVPPVPSETPATSPTPPDPAPPLDPSEPLLVSETHRAVRDAHRAMEAAERIRADKAHEELRFARARADREEEELRIVRVRRELEEVRTHEEARLIRATVEIEIESRKYRAHLERVKLGLERAKVEVESRIVQEVQARTNRSPP